MPQTSIAEWLTERGMGRYAQTFTKQNIEIGLLPRLTDPDLRELGVTLGDRMKILGWIAELRNGGAVPGAKPVEDGNALAAERRQVTVLFCDLVDSTGLSRKLDPEDMREVIRSYQETVTKTIQQLDGFVAGFRGDGVLVYFGYPQAHEDDAERAVRAALDLIAAVGAIASAVPLKTRVGIATGLVVVGDLIGSGDTQERNMIGDTPNLAARLLALAEPNSVVIADEARRMLGDFFDFEDLGQRQVKGIDQPVRAWAVLRSRAVESRFDAMHSAALTEFSGREDELDLLLKRWRKAKDGEGQVVLISGEPGIGKSRLTAALMKEIGAGPHARLRYFCSPQHTDSAFYPVINQMERAAGFAHDESHAEKLDKLDALLSSISATPHDKVLIAGLLSLPTERYPNLDYDAAQRRAKIMEALINQVVMLAARGAVLMILEDAHWIDPTSLESLGRMIERLKRLPILYVITYRPEFNAPWVGESHVSALSLNRLSDREASRIVASIAGNKALPGDVMTDIVERSDGIPLFIEEMTKAVLEAESEGDAKRVVAAAPSHKSSVPASLHASLMARLDRLGSAKGVAQVGAAIGRTFSHQLLAAIARESESELARLIDRLVASGLLFRQGQAPNATYMFKHALVQDAAYSMLLREPRRALHARILEALETKFPDIAESQPELLAHHATEAGEMEKAAEYRFRAGVAFLRGSASKEALIQLMRAQDLWETLQFSNGRLQSQIQTQAHIGTAVTRIHGYSAPETKSAFERLKTLIDEAQEHGSQQESHGQLAFIWGLFGFHLVAYNHPVARSLAEQLLVLGEKRGDSFYRAIGRMEMGKTHFFAGEYREAEVLMSEALAMYYSEGLRSISLEKAQDLSVDASLYRAWTFQALGRYDAAKASIEKAVSDAREIGHAFTLMYALHGLAWFHLKWTDDYPLAESATDEVCRLAEAEGAEFWIASAAIQRGALRSITDEPAAAVDAVRSGIAAWRAVGATIALPLFDTFLARACARNGDFVEARRQCEIAMRTVEETGERAYAVAPPLAAFEIELMSPEPDFTKAEYYAGKALKTAQTLNAKGWELRVALRLARHWRGQGKTREAYDLLAPVYNWFTEGFDWLDMKQAKTLLDELKTSLN